MFMVKVMSIISSEFSKWLVCVLIIATALLACMRSSKVQAQDSRPATSGEVQAGKTAQDGAIFKIPKGYMPAKFDTFKGVLMINPKKAAGMFVVYPNEGETIASVRQRALAVIASMFFHDKDVAAPMWQLNPLPSHTGDNNGELASASAGEMEVRMASYERKENSYLLVYAYFAMRHKSGKSDDGKFLDDQGKGVKEFDQLWQSFGGKK
jgi:hypothetical protein